MPLWSAREKSPVLGDNTWLAPSADVIGDVQTGADCSIWFNVTIRGDVMPIRIGSETNIQDGCTLHGTFKKCGVTIGDRVTVGHNVVLHGCTIGNEVLVGMGSVVMDQASIPDGCIVGAGSLVTENSSFETGMLILGRPAKAVRPVKPNEAAFLKQSADNYKEYTTWYKEGQED